jgi:hypothetical protein
MVTRRLRDEKTGRLGRRGDEMTERLEDEMT